MCYNFGTTFEFNVKCYSQPILFETSEKKNEKSRAEHEKYAQMNY